MADSLPTQWTSAAGNKPWTKLQIITPDLTPLQKLIDFIEKIKEVIHIIVSIIDTIAKLIVGIADALASAIQIIIDKIKTILEGLLTDVGIYALFVPLTKRFNTHFAGLGDLTPPRAGALFSQTTGLNDSQPQEQGQRNFLIECNKYSGGNQGFYRTVSASLDDPGDINRPQFTDATDYVGGLTILLGSSLDPFSFLDALWGLWGMFGGLWATSETMKVPKPQNLHAEAITKPSQDEKFSMLVSWDTVDVPVFTIPDLGNTVLFPTRYAVIVIKNDINLATSMNVVQIMGTKNLTQGLTRPTEFGEAKVVVEKEFNLTTNSVFIRDYPSKLDDNFFVCVAWKLTAFNKDQNPVKDPGRDLGYWYISNIARVAPYVTLPASTPPDWVRTPSVADIFPPLAYFLRMVIGYVEMFASRLLGPADFLKSMVEMLNNEVKRYEALVNDILTKIEDIINMLKIPQVAGGIYTRPFFGQGGNQFFLSDLAKSLSDGYPNAPPFHKGTEYVTGLVLLAGGPELDVRKTIGLLALLFGGASESAEDLATLVNSLGDNVSAAEAVAFGDDLKTVPATPTEAFTPALEPTLKLCRIPDVVSHTFDNALVPLA